MTNNIDAQIAAANADLADSVAARAKRTIWVTFQREGMHKYPAALSDPQLADVKFLGYDHRHIFHFKIGIEVHHNDRDIEFILFKRFCEGLFNEGILQLDYKSCEMISDDLYFQIANRYPRRDIVISVSEDNENGSEIHYNFK